jgi:phosphate-selective porin OprO/OprP
MKHLKSLPTHPLVALAALGSVVVIGCRDAKGPDTPAPEAVAATAAQAVPAPVIDAQQFSALTNQFALAQKAQLELIQRLQGQVVALEQRNSELGASARSERVEQSGQLKAQEQRVQALLARIGELEEKVGSLQAGKVLPEISVAAVEGPTTLELEQKLKVSDRKRELAEEAAAAAAETQAKTAPKISLGSSGFEFRSGDTNFVLRVRGLVQFDSRTFLEDNPLNEGNDGFSLRRARSIVEGTLLGNLDYQFVSEFGGGGGAAIFDANLNYRINPALQIKAGKFRGPVGLEALQPVGTLLFNERSLVTDMVSARSVGVQLWGSVADDVVSYAAGVFNQSGDGRNPNNNDFNDDREFAGRVFFSPFKRTSVAALERLGFGLGASYSQTTTNALALPSPIGGSLPGYTTPGQQQFFAYNPTVGPVVGEGAHWRLSPQARYLYGPFGLMGEYMITSVGVMNLTTQRPDDLLHTAWQVSGQWVLTGEDATFTGIQPRRPFRLGGDGWGAWQLVARYNQLSLDSDTFPSFSNPLYSAEEATSWSVGVNWWLNRNLRVMTGFTHTTFEGGGSPSLLNVPDSLSAPAVVTTQDENVFSTRVQLSF